jgi:hypothetical protein
MHVMYCALRVGFLDDDMIGCMVEPFHMYPCFRCIYVYWLDMLCLVDRLWKKSSGRSCDSTTSEMRRSSPKIISGDS